jgi:type I restriction enzyme M protein
MLAKRFEDEAGSRIAIIFNGSPLFTGDAGSGESEIRRWIIENDWLEGIIALPEQMFYNTGIATYIWIVTNRKRARRKGKVQLINAADFWAPMTPRSLGDKRRWIPPEHRQRIVQLYQAMEENEHSRVFENAEFGYRRVRIERPLRLCFHASPERIARLQEQPAFKALAEGKKRGRAADAAAGAQLQRAILDALRRLPDRPSRDPAEYLRWLDAALKPLKLKEPLRKAILAALTERDEAALPVPGKKGGWEPDPDLRDHEHVPLKYAPSIYDEHVPLKENVYAYFAREVKPYVADAWIDEAFRDEKDGQVGVVGYEINFNRYFLQVHAAAAPRRAGAANPGERARDRRPAARLAMTNAHYPPYPAYKPSGVDWLGEIPAHWEVRRLKFVASVIFSNVDKHSKEEELPIRLCNYVDVYKTSTS